MNIKKGILDIVKRMNFPLRVQSTSIFIYNNLEKGGPFLECTKDSELYAAFCVFLGAKAEDIHANLAERFGALKIDVNKLVEIEARGMERLDFSFLFPDPYQQIAAFCMVERKPLENWESKKRKLEDMLILSGKTYRSIEYAAVAADISKETETEYKVDAKNIEELNAMLHERSE